MARLVSMPCLPSPLVSGK
uniref:Elongation factor 1-alpha n=1 Tax=Rhizophora mucronata TaxID=61149 RepID=A0A2P2M8H9_RHIMU